MWSPLLWTSHTGTWWWRCCSLNTLPCHEWKTKHTKLKRIVVLRNFQKRKKVSRQKKGSRLLYLFASSCSWRKVHWDPCEMNPDTSRSVTAPNLLGGIISLRSDAALICVNNGRSSARDLPQSASAADARLASRMTLFKRLIYVSRTSESIRKRRFWAGKNTQTEL